jgi:hypothetical protein
VGLHRYHLLPKKPRARKKGGRKAKRQAAAANNGPAAKPAASRTATMIAVEDLRVVKALVKRYGYDRVREVLDVLTR